MRTFQDSARRDWTINIGFSEIKRVNTTLGVDLFQAADLQKLCKGLAEVVDVLYVVCQPQADKAGLSDEQFGEMLVTCFQPAFDALFLELAELYDQIGRKPLASLIRKMVDLQKRQQAAQETVLEELLNSGKIDEAIRAVSNKAVAEFNAKIDQAIAGGAPPKSEVAALEDSLLAQMGQPAARE